MSRLALFASVVLAPFAAYAQNCTMPAAVTAAGYTTPVIRGSIGPGSKWSALPGANITYNADGSVTIAGGGGDNWNNQMGSSVLISGGFFAEATLSWTGNAKWLPGNGWPAWWGTVDPPGIYPSTEADFLEAMSGSTGYNGGLHNWLSQTSDINTGGLTGGSFPVPVGTDFSQPHRFGFLSVPATRNTQGSARWFFDGQQVGPTVNIRYGGTFSTLGTEQIKLYLGSGTVNPMTVYEADVWQAAGTPTNVPQNALTQCRRAHLTQR
jgi:hypothetical protein